MLTLLASLAVSFPEPLLWGSYICNNQMTTCYKVNNLPIHFDYNNPWFFPYVGIGVSCNGLNRSFSSQYYTFYPKTYLIPGSKTQIIDCTAGGLQF